MEKVTEGSMEGVATSSTTRVLDTIRHFDPVGRYRARSARLKMENENRLQRRDEFMKQSVERFLMECEERHSWCAYELNLRNFARLLRKEEAEKILREVASKNNEELITRMQENGLMYHRGQIQSNRRWQNSPAKHLDILGHTGPITSVRMSKCLTYVVSTSMDMTTRVWLLRTGKALLTYKGHTKKVTDCDILPNFKMDCKAPCVVTCSGDLTLRLWNTQHEKPVKTLFGHTEAVYRCSFSPDGLRIVSCSEDQTVRTWCFPDGFLLFTYRAHRSPVMAVSFSPSGR